MGNESVSASEVSKFIDDKACAKRYGFPSGAGKRVA